jgi:hypothetical protein
MKALEKGKATNSVMNRIEKIEQEKEQTECKINNLKRDNHRFTEDDLELLQERFSGFLQVKRSINNQKFIRNIIDRIEVDANSVSISLKSGISISRNTKIMMKGTKAMTNNKFEEEIKTIDGMLLSIGESDMKDCFVVKLALCNEITWGFDTIISINAPCEYLYTLAENADKDIFDIVGTEIKTKVAISNHEIVDIKEILV